MHRGQRRWRAACARPSLRPCAEALRPPHDRSIELLTIGNYCDTNSAAPGAQPPEPKDEPEKKAQPGRLVARLERAVEDLGAWQAEWVAADTERLRGPQRERFKKVLTALKAKVLAMEGALG